MNAFGETVSSKTPKATFPVPVGSLLFEKTPGRTEHLISDPLRTTSSARYKRWRHLKQEFEISVTTHLRLHGTTSSACGT